jgi:hypothetical protein
MRGDVERSTASMPAGGEAVPEYFAKGVEFSVHQWELIEMSGEIESFASGNGEQAEQGCKGNNRLAFLS